MENNNQIKTSFYGSLSNTTDELKSQLLLFESTIENDPYLTNFTKSIKKEENPFQTHFNGFLSNTDDILKCTLISFESVYREDPYLKSFINQINYDFNNKYQCYLKQSNLFISFTS